MNLNKDHNEPQKLSPSFVTSVLPTVCTGGGDLGWATTGGVAYISGLATFGADFGRASDVPEMQKENLIFYAVLF